MLLDNYTRHYFDGASCRLSALACGNPDKPDMLLIHGMRDHALSMKVIADQFSSNYHIILLDLRGHGFSDNPGVYTMTQFVADLHVLVQFFKLDKPLVMAHSLGGHIAARFAAIYPEHVSKLILLDGMGPPGMGAAIGDDEFVMHQRADIESILLLKDESRRMRNKGEAMQRLMKNNPRLKEEVAEGLVEHGVESLPDGSVKWRWDPRMNMVWSTFASAEMERIWGLIVCDVLIVTGDEAPYYWTEMRGEETTDLAFYDAELSRRNGLFKSAESAVIKGAGHMLYYDQPEMLNDVIARFLLDSEE